MTRKTLARIIVAVLMATVLAGASLIIANNNTAMRARIRFPSATSLPDCIWSSHSLGLNDDRL